MASKPNRACSMHHRWNNLLFLHWEADVDSLQRMLPPDLTIDTYDGKAYVGLVPFGISNIRHDRFVPIPGLCQFLEINVRTYVHKNGKDPGVWFFSLDAANMFACIGARISYQLPYFYAKMSQTGQTNSVREKVHYSSCRIFPHPKPAFASIDYTVETGPPTRALHGTLDHFLVERYLLYSSTSKGSAVGQVHHTPYGLHRASVERIDENMVEAARITRPNVEPLVHFSRGVDVSVFPLLPV